MANDMFKSRPMIVHAWEVPDVTVYRAGDCIPIPQWLENSNKLKWSFDEKGTRGLSFADTPLRAGDVLFTHNEGAHIGLAQNQFFHDYFETMPDPYVLESVHGRVAIDPNITLTGTTSKKQARKLAKVHLRNWLRKKQAEQRIYGVDNIIARLTTFKPKRGLWYAELMCHLVAARDWREVTAFYEPWWESLRKEGLPPVDAVIRSLAPQEDGPARSRFMKRLQASEILLRAQRELAELGHEA